MEFFLQKKFWHEIKISWQFKSFATSHKKTDGLPVSELPVETFQTVHGSLANLTKQSDLIGSEDF